MSAGSQGSFKLMLAYVHATWQCCVRRNGHLGMSAAVTHLTPKPMQVLHHFAHMILFTAALHAAELLACECNSTLIYQL